MIDDLFTIDFDIEDIMNLNVDLTSHACPNLLDDNMIFQKTGSFSVSFEQCKCEKYKNIERFFQYVVRLRKRIRHLENQLTKVGAGRP